MNILQLAEQKGLKPYRSGGNDEYACAAGCPGCGKNPDSKRSDRFRLWPGGNHGRGAYWCRQCGMHGDNIQFLIDFSGKTFKEACDILRIDFKAAHTRTLQQPPAKPAWQPRPAITPAEIWRKKAYAFACWAHENLINTPDQMAYLAGRGIDADRVRTASLGWNPQKFFRPRSSWGLDGVLKDDGSKRLLCLPPGIVIPYYDGDNIVRLRIRTGEVPPYHMVPGSSHEPMVIKPALPCELSAWVVIEAELDGQLLARSASDLPGVGIIAAGNTTVQPTSEQTDMLRASFEILIAMDYDGTPAPGPDGKLKKQPGAKASAWWLEQFPQAVRWPVPATKDPGDWFKSGATIEDITSWLRAGLSPRMRMAMEHSRQSRVITSAKAGEAVEVAPEVDQRMAALIELQKAMRRFDARLDKSHGGIFIKCRTSEGESTVSACIYADSKHEVWQYLDQHPAEIVTAANFWQGLKNK